MVKEVKENEIAVLYEIVGLDEDGHYYFNMDTSEYSIYEN